MCYNGRDRKIDLTSGHENYKFETIFLSMYANIKEFQIIQSKNVFTAGSWTMNIGVGGEVMIRLWPDLVTWTFDFGCQSLHTMFAQMRL